MLEKNWRIFWKFAGIFNIFFGALMLIDKELFYKVIGAEGMAPADASWMNMVGCVVVIFGFAYYAVGRNLQGHLDVVIIGAIGKVAVCWAFALPHLLGTAGENNPWQMGLLTGVDFLFGCIFAYYYFKASKQLPSYQHAKSAL